MTLNVSEKNKYYQTLEFTTLRWDVFIIFFGNSFANESKNHALFESVCLLCHATPPDIRLSVLSERVGLERGEKEKRISV